MATNRKLRLIKCARRIVRRYYDLRSTVSDRQMGSVITGDCISKADSQLAILEESERIKSEEGKRSIPSWGKTRAAVFERDVWQCAYCMEVTETPHCDHIHPYSKGGSNDMDNLVTSCQSCNTSKGNKILSKSKLEDVQRFIGLVTI